MTFNVRSSIAVIAVAVGFSGVVRQASAATVFDSGGFEPPRYITGELSGQDTQGPWLKDAGTGTALVETATKLGGAQAVQFTRPAAATGDTRYGVLKPLTPTGSLQILRVSWDMNVTQANVANVPFGPFFGVEGYDAFNDDPKLIGSLGVDATTGDILYQDEDGFFAETGVLAPFGQWNHYTLEMNYNNHQYTVFYNGAPLATSPFVDNELGITAFTDAPLAALAATFESIATATGTAYFDNYGIEIVPEPSTMAIIGLASLGLLRRRRSVA